MMRLGTCPLLTAALLAAAYSRADTLGQMPDFKEVYDLVHSNLPGLSDAELDRAAARGLAAALGPKVSLLTNSETADSSDSGRIIKTSRFDDGIGYVRIERVGQGLPKEITTACQSLDLSNKLNGIVLDLRYAGGGDYAAAASTADLFLRKEKPLLNWGEGTVRSTDKTDAITVPIAVLVNHQTAGASEALAAVLREVGSALILGNRTAGKATMGKEFPLKNGDRLRIATTPVQIGDGSTIPVEGLKPDITVEVSPEDERVYYADAFKVIGKSDAKETSDGSNPDANSSRRQRFNEAELVRERREGLSRDATTPARKENEPDAPVVRDPVLARAIDLLKGLAVVRQSRS